MSDRRVVVVIEQDEAVRALLRATLGEAGFEVHCAESGEAGIALVRAKEPDTVTLDVVLPDMDGYEVARRIREFSHTYLLILTAHSDLAATVMGFDAGADDYMVKPIRPRELRVRLDGMLRRPRQLRTEPRVLAGAMAAGVQEQDPVPAAPSGAGLPAAVGPAAGLGLAAGLGPGAGLGPDAGLGPAGSVVRDAVASRYEHKGLQIDSLTRGASIEGRPLELTRTEFDLLRILLERGPGHSQQGGVGLAPGGWRSRTWEAWTVAGPAPDASSKRMSVTCGGSSGTMPAHRGGSRPFAALATPWHRGTDRTQK